MMLRIQRGQIAVASNGSHACQPFWGTLRGKLAQALRLALAAATPCRPEHEQHRDSRVVRSLHISALRVKELKREPVVGSVSGRWSDPLESDRITAFFSTRARLLRGSANTGAEKMRIIADSSIKRRVRTPLGIQAYLTKTDLERPEARSFYGSSGRANIAPVSSLDQFSARLIGPGSMVTFMLRLLEEASMK